MNWRAVCVERRKHGSGRGGRKSVERQLACRLLYYTKEDFSARAERYDLIFDTVAKSKYAKVLAPNGSYVTIAKLDSKESMENLLFIKELVETGELKPVIDRCYPLEQMVEAHRYVEQGHKKGNVVITLEPHHVK